MPNSNDIMDNRTRDILPLPQPNAPPRFSPPVALPTGTNPITPWTRGFLCSSVGLAFWRREKFLVLTGIRTLDSHWAVGYSWYRYPAKVRRYSAAQIFRYTLLSVFAFFHFSHILPLLATVLPHFLESSFLFEQADSNSNISEFYFCCVQFDCRQKYEIFWDFWNFLGSFKPIPISTASYYTTSIASNPNLLTVRHLSSFNYRPSLNEP